MSADPTTDETEDIDSSRTPEPCDRELSRNEIFDILRNSRRRAVINHLRMAGTSMTLGELAEQIASDECDASVKQLTSKQRKRVYVSLHQNHLPKMDSKGVVNYDQDRGTVELGDISRVTPHLSSEVDDSIPRHLYMVLAVCTVFIVGLSVIGPLSAVSAIAWVLVAVVLLCFYRKRAV